LTPGVAFAPGSLRLDDALAFVVDRASLHDHAISAQRRSKLHTASLRRALRDASATIASLET